MSGFSGVSLKSSVISLYKIQNPEKGILGLAEFENKNTQSHKLKCYDSLPEKSRKNVLHFFTETRGIAYRYHCNIVIAAFFRIKCEIIMFGNASMLLYFICVSVHGLPRGKKPIYP